MKLRKTMAMVIAVVMLAALCVPAVNAADTSYVSLLDIPMKSWIMQDATSEDAEPKYAPGIGVRGMKDGEAPGAAAYYNVVNAKQYKNAIGTIVTSDTEPAEIVYDISGYDYDTFSATVGKTYSDNGGVGKEAQFLVYVDGELKAESPIVTNISDYYIECDIKGGKELKLVANAGTDGANVDNVAWCNPVLFNKADVKVVDIKLKGVSYVTELGKDLDTTVAFGLVTYDSGAEKKVAAADIAVSNFYKDIEGKQTITLTYEGATSTQEIYVASAGKYEYLCDTEWASYVMNGGSSDELLSNAEPIYHTLENEEYPCITGGVTYQHGIWTHPTGNAGNNGLGTIVYELGGHNKFHCVVGKANDTYCYKGQYHIYLDDELIESSPVLDAGENYVFDIDTEGASQVTLAVTGGEPSDQGDFYHWDSTLWADPVIYTSIGDAAVPAAPETEAPVETEAPETEAPVETATPETEASVETATPETAAPEIEAPEVVAPVETAPQTFDAGVVAAIAAIVAGAGTIVAKKRK